MRMQVGIESRFITRHLYVNEFTTVLIMSRKAYLEHLIAVKPIYHWCNARNKAH